MLFPVLHSVLLWCTVDLMECQGARMAIEVCFTSFRLAVLRYSGAESPLRSPGGERPDSPPDC